jgi:hypothetical protein
MFGTIVDALSALFFFLVPPAEAENKEGTSADPNGKPGA